jgi:N-acetylmuramoyl-L-alanine amidase
VSRRLVALPVAAVALAGTAQAAGPVVVIDPGHDRRANLATEPIGPGSATRKIKDGGGTHGVVTTIREADLVLDVSLRLRALLRRVGVEVVMTRASTSGASMGNVARARIANRVRASLLLRVHADGHPSSAVRGTHTLVPALRTGWTDDVYRPSRRAAALVQAEVVRALGFPDRGIGERSDFTGFNWADVPVILVELGFMTNPVDDRRLARSAVRDRAALGLCRGTLRYLGLAPGRCGGLDRAKALR